MGDFMKKMIFLVICILSSYSLFSALIPTKPEGQDETQTTQLEPFITRYTGTADAKLLQGLITSDLMKSHMLRWTALSQAYSYGVRLNDSFPIFVGQVLDRSNDQLIEQESAEIFRILRGDCTRTAGVPYHAQQFKTIEDGIKAMTRRKPGSLSTEEKVRLQQDMDSANEGIARAGTIKALFAAGRLPSEQQLQQYLALCHSPQLVAFSDSKIEVLPD